MIQNQAGVGLAPLGNLCNIAGCLVTSDVGPEMFRHQVVLLKKPKDARLAPDGFSNLRV